MVTTEKPAYKVVGTRPIRHDGVDKVIGRAEYGADVRLPGMLPARSCAAPTPTPASSASTAAAPKPIRACAPS